MFTTSEFDALSVQEFNSNTGLCANKKKNTAKILNLPERCIKLVWDMLADLNSPHKMINITAFRAIARRVFKIYLEVLLMLLFTLNYSYSVTYHISYFSCFLSSACLLLD